MRPSSRFRAIAAASAAARLEAAASFLRSLPADGPVTIVGATRGAADDLARRVAASRVATFGTSRFSLLQLAARLAAAPLAARGVAPATSLGIEAVAARAVFDIAGSGTLTYLRDAAATPGFPRALARTMADLRLAGVPAEQAARAGPAGDDLARLLARIDRELEGAGSADRARLFDAAIDGIAAQPFMRGTLLLLDVAIESAAEERFVTAIAAAARGVFATVPVHDRPALAALERAGAAVDKAVEPRATDLDCLRAFLFAGDAPPARELDGSLELFSAPGEGRECAEIARRVLAEARRGVPFDEMAILVRSGDRYQGLLEHALVRAGVPAWFDRGIRKPHPAGRAFLALLACAAEGLSASRFAEYLSLGQVPPADRDAGAWVAALDDVLGPAVRDNPEGIEEEDEEQEAKAERGDTALSGTLPAPRHWERMLVEASVIGGLPERWERRLDGLSAQLEARGAEARRDDEHSPRADAIDRDLAFLRNLRDFALPIVRELGAWPGEARWGEWLDRLSAFAPRTLRAPSVVLRVLADLRPMMAVGPVGLDEVRRVLADRLRLLEAEPPARRYGRVCVGAPVLARGRTFRIVFVPGLAERMFPRKPEQDPLLLDEDRARLDERLATRADRAQRERLLLHLAAGAATDRLYVSYPRLDVSEARARVPSFYALDVLRGATGSIPGHEQLAEAAARAGDRTLAWPAPADPAAAIDDQEHDLAVLRTLLDAADPESVRGHAQYLLRLEPALRRSVTERWARGERRWSNFDGLIRVADRTRDALAAQRLTARPYSLSALQRYAACPYQFLLGAIYRFAPADDPQPLQRLDPLMRGSIVHRMQMLTLRALQSQNALPVTQASLDAALATLHEVVRQEAERSREELVPAIERVWREEIAAIARDLRGWLRHMAEEGAVWVPRFFELAFGLPPSDERDPHSVPDPVTIGGRYTLRGAVDLVEEHRVSGTLRVTDHKTGKDRTKEGLTIGGGAVLQPVLYSAAVEQITGRTVEESRLFFCTTAAGYKIRPVALTDRSRRAGVEALEVIDRAVEQGFLAAAPAEGACRWCDFRIVCGPNEEPRVARKPIGHLLQDLIELRSRP